MIQYKVGDILQSNKDIIINGVNCQGSFGSGLAGQIAKKYPRVREDYIWKHRNGGWFLGDLQYCLVNDRDSRFIVNAATQLNYGYDKKLYCNYEAIEQCVRKVLVFADREKYSIALPKIGCGLANGDWNGVVKPLLDSLSESYPKVSISVYSLANERSES